MEYCQLSDLAQFMKKREQLTSLPETADIFKKYPNSQYGLNEVLVRHFIKQIASAIEYLRNRNLIHRDIKPQNLLLNPSPAFMARQDPQDVPLAASEHSLVPAVGVMTLPMLKIADFGFARHLPQQMMAETLCGSPLYMAPEILSYQKYDAKADLWSVGTVAYEMMVGKPPFRAANHIELLKKIDDAHDRIPFPSSLNISQELHRMIKSLLKRQPTERSNFEGFFKSSPVVDPIPGLVGDDVPRQKTTAMMDVGMSDLARRMAKQTVDETAIGSLNVDTSFTPRQMVKSPEDVSPMTRPGRVMISPANRVSPDTLETSYPTTQPVDIKRPARRSDEMRPPMVSHATAPARDLLMGARYSARNPTGIERNSSLRNDISSSSAPRDDLAVPSRAASFNDRVMTEPRREVVNSEKVAQDIAFEKEYVLVEKKAVEVNAFADELAANKDRSAQQRNSKDTRTMSQGNFQSSTSLRDASPSSALQLASSRRNDSNHNRQPSFERRMISNPTSASNMLSKALNMANARLFGVLGASPPIGGGFSSPPGYAGFPAYPTPSIGQEVVITRDKSSNLDEDARILKIVKEAATRSDTVYSFAEVKYRQLLPSVPSAITTTRQKQKQSSSTSVSDDVVIDDEQELTQIAVVAVSEEALVLFVKALAILAKTIDLANYWWTLYRNNKASSSSSSPPLSRPGIDGVTRSSSVDVPRRMNSVVQWLRNRFNECLEKSEIVGRRLVEAQKRLPEDHPGHPSNYQQISSDLDSKTKNTTTRLGSASSSAGSLGVMTSTEDIHLTSGVTAERLMFERAVEMSRAAAVNELVGDDLRGCEINYKTAIVLLEAVLDVDDEPLISRNDKDKELQHVDDTGNDKINGLDGQERRTVLQRKFYSIPSLSSLLLS